MCYNNGAKMADEVSVNYANNAGYASSANYADIAGVANSVRDLFGQKYYAIGSTIYAGITPDENLTYGATIAGSRLTVGVGIDFDGTRTDGGGVSPSCPGTWVKVSGWSNRKDGLGFWRRIA